MQALHDMHERMTNLALSLTFIQILLPGNPKRVHMSAHIEASVGGVTKRLVTPPTADSREFPEIVAVKVSAILRSIGLTILLHGIACLAASLWLVLHWYTRVAPDQALVAAAGVFVLTVPTILSMYAVYIGELALRRGESWRNAVTQAALWAEGVAHNREESSNA